jgi:DNA repair protein RecO (recombination protein O)
MAPTRTEAVILQAIDYSDTSRIFRLFTPEFGLQSVIAKGVRRSGHRLTGVLESLNHVEVVYYRRPNRSLFTLSQATAVETFPGLASDIHRYYRASVIAEMILRLGTEEDGNPALFRVLLRSLRALSRRPIASLSERMFAAVWEILGFLGYSPRTEACAVCDAGVAETDTLPFSIADGGVLCGRCAGAPGGRRLDVSPGVRRLIAAAVGANRLYGFSPGEEETLMRLTEDYIHYHVRDRRPLSSWALMRSLRG